MAKVKIETHLYERVQKVAAAAGYSSVEELIAHTLEEMLKQVDIDAAEEQVTDQLRGLGYIE
jgi:hypothetical protein